MIEGKIVLEDVVIVFKAREDLRVEYQVTDLVDRIEENLVADQAAFFKALAIAVHNDGMPDYRADYADAEAIMGKIRWIP